MESREDTKSCRHCNKEVSQPNLDLHESHCSRFLCLCPVCKEPVPRESLEQHQSDQHVQVRCTQCKTHVERCHLLDHQSEECEGRLQCCRFCQLEVPWRNLGEHVEACSSRTELCPDCDRYVKLRDRDEHTLQCSGPSGQSQNTLKLTCRHCRKPFPADQTREHQLACNFSSLIFGDAQQDQRPRPRPGTPSFTPISQRRGVEDMDQISTCLHCNLALPLATLKWHEIKCRKYQGLNISVEYEGKNALMTGLGPASSAAETDAKSDYDYV